MNSAAMKEVSAFVTRGPDHNRKTTWSIRIPWLKHSSFVDLQQASGPLGFLQTSLCRSLADAPYFLSQGHSSPTALQSQVDES